MPTTKRAKRSKTKAKRRTEWYFGKVLNLTRRAVLKAIREEPLAANAFIKPITHTNELGHAIREFNSQCAVCAVGAVLRRAGVPDLSIEYAGVDYAPYASGAYPPQAALKEKMYLTALSRKFEQLVKAGNTIAKTRKLLAAWVRRNLPVRFRVRSAEEARFTEELAG